MNRKPKIIQHFERDREKRLLYVTCNHLVPDYQGPKRSWERLREENIMTTWDCLVPDYRKQEEKILKCIW